MFRLKLETALLDRLQVYPTASSEEIWFAYFCKVYEYLKDRLQDTEDIEKDLSKLVIEESLRDDARLMDLTEAYQVLSDPESREAYFNHGSLPGPASLVHYSVMLQMVFGSTHFHDYVGTMRFKSLADVVEASSHLTTRDLMRKVLAKNKELLEEKVGHLVGVMNDILQLSSTDLRTRALEDDQRFSSPRAFDMLKTIGSIYKSNAAKLRPSRDQGQAVPQGYSNYQKESTLWEVCMRVLADLAGREKKKRAKKLKEFGQILEKLGKRMEEKSGGTREIQSGACFCSTLLQTNHRF